MPDCGDDQEVEKNTQERKTHFREDTSNHFGFSGVLLRPVRKGERYLYCVGSLVHNLKILYR